MSNTDYPAPSEVDKRDIDGNVEVDEDETNPEPASTGDYNKKINYSDYTIIGADGGPWPVRENYYGEVIEIRKNSLIVDCLVDIENKKFEKREFKKLLFENISDLSVGKYVLIKIFERKGKSIITVDNAEKLVDKSIFEDDSEYQKLEGIENPDISINKL